MAALTENPMRESRCVPLEAADTAEHAACTVCEWAPGLGLFLSWFSLGASELGSPGVTGTLALIVTVHCLVPEGLGASWPVCCGLEHPTPASRLKSPSRISPSLLCILEADILHMSFGIIQLCALQLSPSHRKSWF